MIKTTETKTSELPPGVLKSDLEYPKWKEKGPQDRVLETLTFYLVSFRSGKTDWVLTTLHISKGRRAGTADRSYAVNMDGTVCRVGAGPHVKKTLTVYVRESRKDKLQKYLDLHEKGLATAGQIRDRIGSRRAEGQIKRAQGLRSWTWDN